MKLNLLALALRPFGISGLESQRDSVLQPRVATKELPWVNAPATTNPNGVVASSCFSANLNSRTALALALVATLAATGCKHTPPPVTKIHDGGPVGNPSTPPPDYSTRPINPDGNAPKPALYTGGPIEEVPTWDPHNMIQNAEKLAPYTVHFKYDSSVVEDTEQSNLAAVSDALKADPNAKLLIAGHCDERGTDEYNRSLGERRALALREALAKAGIVPDRVRTTSFGKDQPADSAHNEAAWAKNRRGQFIWCTAKPTTP